MRVYFYQDVPNFGDMLNKHMWQKFFGRLLQQRDDLLMFGIGTLIGAKVSHTGRTVVFGSGVGYQGKPRNVLKSGEIVFVRGPLSAQVLGLSPDKAITDPAILAPEVFPASAKNDSVIFIPHWETSYNPLWKRACQLAGITYVDPLGDVASVIAHISSARLVITEAMHGAILADAYRVPWVPVSTSPRINLFKWNDWAFSLDMPSPQFSYFGMMGVSDFIRAAIHDAATMKEIVSYIGQRDDDMHRRVQHESGGIVVRVCNWMLSHLVPQRFRYGVDRLLMSKVGPFCDSVLDRLAASGVVLPGLRRNVAQLKALASLPGNLSSEAVSENRRQQIYACIAAVNETYLVQEAAETLV